jgi:hypothetical protein
MGDACCRADVALLSPGWTRMRYMKLVAELVERRRLRRLSLIIEAAQTAALDLAQNRNDHATS